MDEQVICVSNDKDLLQLPGWHYNFVTKQLKLVSPLEGLRAFYKQLILGDRTDNIPGYDGKLRGECPKFIAKLQEPIDEMTEEWDMYDYVYEQYLLQQPAYVGEVREPMHRNAQLLYILKNEEEYWHPPTEGMP